MVGFPPREPCQDKLQQRAQQHGCARSACQQARQGVMALVSMQRLTRGGPLCLLHGQMVRRVLGMRCGREVLPGMRWGQRVMMRVVGMMLKHG